jgi:putative nucleotidyltransferase with HDIG domain
MSDPVRFLSAFSNALASASLYGEGHPAYARAADAAYRQLQDLQADSGPRLRFSFLDGEVVFGERLLHELQAWDWSSRLTDAGIQRIEVSGAVSQDEFDGFLEQVASRLAQRPSETATARQESAGAIRFGQLGVRRERLVSAGPEKTLIATLNWGLREECETLRWMHDEVENRGKLPLLEAEAVVASLSVAMHAEQAVILPLLNLKEFDQYTTTHSMNVAVLAMALAESLELGAAQVRAVGVAGLLHDLGKVRIPREVLLKPGRLTDAERAEIQRHPAEGARIILAGQQQLDLAAVVAYEHHIMLDGTGYPCRHFARETHYGSRLVHVCDVYDALRTRRPYREAWESEAALTYIEERAGVEFDPALAHTFTAMMRRWDHRVMEAPAAR